MNRSFRAQDSLMPSIRPRVPQLRNLREPTMKEKEDDLALFLEMRKKEKEKNDLLLQNSEDMDESLALQSGTLFNNVPSAPPARKTGADEFLNSENDKNDYDWLLTPPGTPLFPSLDMESRKTYLGETEAPATRPTSLKSRLANPQPEASMRSGLVQRQTSSSPGLSSTAGLRRPSSSGGPSSRPVTPLGGPGSRPATPTGRASLTTSSKASRPSTPTSRPTLSSAKPGITTSTRSTTPSVANRSTASSKSSVLPRSSTPTRSSTPSRSSARSSTPTSRSTARPSTPVSRSTSTVSTAPRSLSRPSTPTRRPSTPSKITSTTASLSKSSSSVNKPGPATTSKNPGPSRGTSPTVRSRPWKPSEMPGFSLDAPPNLRTTLPDRPLSASRGRPGGPTARSASVEPTINPGRQRRQSCSPSRGRAPNGTNHMSGSSVPAVNRMLARANEEISPVVMGNKMVERVINMRKLAPPRQDGKHSPSLSGKSASSPDSTGFGRTLSKKSLDMAIRHMDIRRTIPGNLRPLMTNIPASSMYSVRSGPSRSRTISVSDSPLATSSNTSSDLSVTNANAAGMLDMNVMEDDHSSDMGGRPASPTSTNGFAR